MPTSAEELKESVGGNGNYEVITKEFVGHPGKQKLAVFLVDPPILIQGGFIVGDQKSSTFLIKLNDNSMFGMRIGKEATRFFFESEEPFKVELVDITGPGDKEFGGFPDEFTHDGTA